MLLLLPLRKSIEEDFSKDKACIEARNFENDEVEIRFDEEGNRIYEEIKLYAGWEKENWWD
jgi:hypothetical protein